MLRPHGKEGKGRELLGPLISTQKKVLLYVQLSTLKFQSKEALIDQSYQFIQPCPTRPALPCPNPSFACSSFSVFCRSLPTYHDLIVASVPLPTSQTLLPSSLPETSSCDRTLRARYIYISSTKNKTTYYLTELLARPDLPVTPPTYLLPTYPK